MPTIEVQGRRNSLNVQKVMWTLGELNLDYERHDVGGSFGFPADYAQRNPNGVIPTIQDGNLTLWESNVCVRYLAQRYGEAGLWPARARLQAQADQWMEWQRSEIGTAFFQVFINMIRLPAEQSKPALVPPGVAALGRWYTVLDTHLSQHEFVAGEQFSAGDIPLGAMTYRYMNLEIDRPPLGHVQRWYEQLCARQPYQRHVMIPFGRNHSQWQDAEAAGAGIQ